MQQEVRHELEEEKERKHNCMRAKQLIKATSLETVQLLIYFNAKGHNQMVEHPTGHSALLVSQTTSDAPPAKSQTVTSSTTCAATWASLQAPAARRLTKLCLPAIFCSGVKGFLTGHLALKLAGRSEGSLPAVLLVTGLDVEGGPGVLCSVVALCEGVKHLQAEEASYDDLNMGMPRCSCNCFHEEPAI